MNQIKAAIRRMKDQIAERIALGMTTEAKVEATRKQLDMTMEEFVKFQELKSLAVAEQVLTPEEGQHIYGLLGETPGHFNGQAVEVKSVLTQVFKELLDARIRAIKAAHPRPEGWDHV
jgi:hypothetical protein